VSGQAAARERGDPMERELEQRIRASWEALGRGEARAVDAEAVEAVIDRLDRGALRVAEPAVDGWVTHEWVKLAVLLYLRIREATTIAHGPFEYRDKVPVKTGFEAAGVRVVPPATVRRGAYVAPGAVLMPCYVNIGAWVGPGTMVDTWATVGSCAQIGADVHLAGGVGIGGVLEPPQAAPVIVEDGAFIGSRCVVVEGVHVGARAVLGAGVVLTANTPVIDVTGPEPVEVRGRVPPGAIVVPGTRARGFPAGSYGLPCGLVIGYRTEATEDKVRLNELLREHGSSLQ
jgi:2,3,4,5-tetrahydropyridine-2-carboxylate N-succinyltransferase